MTWTPWIQVYDPLASPWLSTAAAAFPIVLLLVALGVFEWRAHLAALAGLVSALAVSILIFGMPVPTATATALYGAAYGFMPIGWIVLNAVFLYNLTVETGQFEILKSSVGRLSADRRIQALLVAFSFGAFIEGASGFGTPVAICAALLIGLGFTPLYAAGLALIANTAPVAFGAIGTPILTLAAVTGLPAATLSAMAGRQLPFVSVIVPVWLVVTMSGWRGVAGVWPAVLISGGVFAIAQYAWSNFVGPELVDIIGGLLSLGALTVFCRLWKPREVWLFPEERTTTPGTPTVSGSSGRRTAGAAAPSGVAVAAPTIARPALIRAWMPWVFLSVMVILWGLPSMKALMNGGAEGLSAFRAGRPAVVSMALSPTWDVPLLHRYVYRDFPVEATAVDRAKMSEASYRNTRAEAARYNLNWLSATGTGILIAAILTAFYL